MTGDGVNDAPALKGTDIRVARCITGSDVPKESSASLLDDNSATIVRAVRKGRKIYDNLGQFIKSAVTTHSGEIWTIFFAPFIGPPILLLPIQPSRCSSQHLRARLERRVQDRAAERFGVGRTTAAASAVFVAVEIEKWAKRRRGGREPLVSRRLSRKEC